MPESVYLKMDRIFIAETERSPEVDFDFPNHSLSMAGESYPEDAAAFFGPLIESLKKFLDQPGPESLTFDLRMSYFNSSSAKALMNMFQLLESAAEKGSRIVIRWHYHEDDDTMEEFGEDFSEDFSSVDFQMHVIKEDGSEG